MTTFSIIKHSFIRSKKHLLQAIILLFFISFFPFFSSCSKQVDYFSYVSELRSNIFFAETDELSLRVYSVCKETPYIADGIPREIAQRTEIYLSAPSGEQEYTVSFTVNGKTHGGDMSFDNVKAEYYYSCTLDISSLLEIVFQIGCGEEKTELIARSVVKDNTMTPRAALQTLESCEKEFFQSMTDKYGFAGEIYLRLIYEDAPYYYIGVIDRSGNTTAFLLNGETGKILAKRQA